MKFWQKNAHVSRGLNDFLNEGFLVQEIGLKFEDALIAAITAITFLAFFTKVRPEQTSLGKNGFDALWLVREV